MTFRSMFKKHCTIQQSAEKNMPWISPAVDLPNHDKGAFVVIPSRKGTTELRGYLIALIDFNQAFEIHLNPAEFSVLIFYSNTKILQSGAISPEKSQNYYTDG